MISKIRFLKRYIWVVIRGFFVPNGEQFNPHGVLIKLPRSADISIRYLLARGRPYEGPEARMVQKYISHGFNVIELGGCYGIISALIRKQIGPHAKHIIEDERQTKLIKLLETHKFEVIKVKLRHMYTQGGGIHCATLDTVRDSKLESYF